jgi:hypothetical protein
MRFSTFRAAILVFGLLAVLDAKAKADEAVDSTRESIIQGVRDDIRRKIQERNEAPAEKRPEVASEAKPAASTTTPVHNNPKPDTPK